MEGASAFLPVVSSAQARVQQLASASAIAKSFVIVPFSPSVLDVRGRKSKRERRAPVPRMNHENRVGQRRKPRKFLPGRSVLILMSGTRRLRRAPGSLIGRY